MFDYEIKFNLLDNMSNTVRKINSNVMNLGQSASKTVKKYKIVLINLIQPLLSTNSHG